MAKACPDALYPAVRNPLGVNVAALTDECTSVGVSDITTSVSQYAQCLVRQHECVVDELATYEMPRAAELIDGVDFPGLGLDPAPKFPPDFCPTLTTAPTP